MNKSNRQVLEENDLAILYDHFEHNKVNNSIVYPKLENRTSQDLWTEVIEVISGGDKEKLNALYAKVNHSKLTVSSKRWWLSVITLLNEAPLDEIKKYYTGNHEMPQKFCEESIAVIIRRFTLDYSEERIKAYADERREQEHKLRELKQKANEDMQKKEQAEMDLKRHREKRWN